MRAKPCGKWWCSDVTTPFDYMKSMAELWGQGGKDFVEAQQKFFAEMGKATGGEAFKGVQGPTFDPQGLAQANDSFTKMWSSALELSQTISRNMQSGEKQDAAVQELLGKIFDPRAWFSGTDGLDQALTRMAEGPQLADLWNTERKMLILFNAWAALRRRSLEHNTVMLEAWLQAAGKFAKDLNEKADRKEAVGSWRDVLSLWVETANTALLETQRSEPYLKSQREILKASTDLRLAQREMTAFYSEMFGYPTREELDDVHRTVTELRRELRALQRRSRGDRQSGDVPQKRMPDAVPETPSTKPLADAWQQYDRERGKR
jgi:polyhydroxyalkanoate synthase subunit PhaE